MKILHLTTHLNRGGISNYIYTVGIALKEKGIEVFVGSSGGEMEEEYKEKGLHVKTFSMRTKSELSPKIYLSLPELIQYAKEEGIDLIHAHTRVSQVMAQWVWWLAGIPFITTAHGFYKRRLGRRLMPAWGKFAIAISEGVGVHLKEYFRIPSENIRVIFNGVDIQELSYRFLKHNPKEVRREYQIPEGTHVIGTTARLVPDKGHEYLIRAVKSLEGEIENLMLIIVGDGRYRKYLEDLARELKISHKIYFTGNLKDVSKPLSAMDVFVLPAIWREGFGLSIAEAMACQKPVIVTNIWALNTLIENGVNGILVEPRNVPELADAIQLLIKDPSFRDGIALEGKRTAEHRFSLDRMADELENLYREVVGNTVKSAV